MKPRVLYLLTNLHHGAGIERTLIHALDAFGDSICPHVASIHRDDRHCGPSFIAAGAAFSDLGAVGRRRWRSRLRLLQLIRRERIGIVHAIGRRPIREGLRAKRLLPTIRLVGDISTRHAPRGGPAKHERYLRRQGRRLDAIVCVSEALRADFSRNTGISEDVIQVIPAGRPLDRLRDDRRSRQVREQVRRSLGIAEDTALIVCAARLTPEKDHATLLDAFSRVCTKLPGIHLVLLGEGSCRPAIEEEIRTLGLKDRVQLCGYREDVADFLDAADLFCLTSRQEGLSGAVIEAQAAALPCVVTASGGPTEIVRDGETGLVCPVGDKQAIADAIEKLAADPERRARMGEAARAAVSRFDVARTKGAWLAIYRDLLRTTD